MIPDLGYDRVAPELIKVDSLKINVRDEIINDDPAFLTSQQSLIVGRQEYGNCNIYNFIVDHEGVMINAPLNQRTEVKDQYALLVNGNVYVTGSITSGSSNFEGKEYDPLGRFECVADTSIPLDSLVEVAGYASGVLKVRLCNTEYSTAIFGVCTGVKPPGTDGAVAGLWSVQVQTAGVGVVKCDGIVEVGDMLTSGLSGVAIRTMINGEIIDTAIHGYTIGKALQASADVTDNRIRCLFNVIQAPPAGQNNLDFWELGSNESANIFYSGNVTVGRDFATRGNMYALNVVASADRTIDHAQVNIQNTMSSRMRLAVVGTSNVSPAIVNTDKGTSIEFHAGRTQDYFDKMYTSRQYGPISSQNSTVWTQIVSEAEVPDYKTYNAPSDAPHLRIGDDGNVGIHTSMNPAITYQIRKQQLNGLFPTVTEPMTLHVEGSTYTCNLMVWDYETGYPKNVDELYVRRLGKTFLADTIVPGTFANGGYSFPSNVGVTGPWTTEYGLKVWDNAKFVKNVEVDGVTKIANLQCENSVFEKDINANNDILVAGSIRLEGGIYVSVLSNIEEDGTEQYTWQAIDFKPASGSNTDFNHVGEGLTTPGRLGIGVTAEDATARNDLQSQLVVNKRNPSSSTNVWELELKDLSSARFTPVGWIGHPIQQNASGPDDASLFFATPPRKDSTFSGVYAANGYNTNMYFYPGKGSRNGIDVSQPPSFAIFNDGKVGVGTKAPQASAQLTVIGSISFTESLIFFDQNTAQNFEIGLWKSATFSTTRANVAPTFRGIQYNNAAAPHVGVNVQPDVAYGVVLGSNIKVLGGTYTGNDSKLSYWYDGTDSNTINVVQTAKPRDIIPSMYCWGNVGIGVKQPLGDLDIKNYYGKPTSLRVLCDDATLSSSVQLAGENGTWKMYSKDNERSMHFGYDDTKATDTTVNPIRPLWMQWDRLNQKPQTFIGCTTDVLNKPLASNLDKSASLFVEGGVSVIGNVRISGTYYADGKVVFNSNAATPSNLGVDDVYIGGGHVILNAGGDKSVIMGNPLFANEIIDEGNPSMFRVYGNITNPVIASFKTGRTEGLLEVASSTGARLRFGALDPQTRNGSPFAFMDKFDQPYIAFNRSQDTSNTYYVGFNTWNPDAVLHVTSAGTGSNMLRLTTTKNQETGDSAAPQIELERKSGDLSTAWTITGPNVEYRDKLAFLYKDPNTALKEVFCFTSNGCVGIGTDQPQFAIDVANTGSLGGLRLANSGDTPSPQIILQSGDPIFGADDMLDHRLYSYSNNLHLDATKTDQVISVLHVASNGNIGMRSNADLSHTVTIGGTLNVTQAILLNGSPLFSTNDSIAQETAYLSAVSVYLKPRPLNGGGVHVNTDLETETGNLFYILSGADRNMMVYDSLYDECQLHMRTKSIVDVYNTWRMGTETTKFYWELWENSGNSPRITQTHVPYIRALEIGKSTRTSGDFDATLRGHLVLTPSQASVTMGNGVSLQASSLCNLSMRATNFNFTSLTSSCNLLTVANSNNSVVNVITREGGIGIGTSSVRAGCALDVTYGQIFGINGSASIPTYSFASTSNSGIFCSNVANSNSVRVTVDGTVAGTFTSGALSVPNFTCAGPMQVITTSRQAIQVTSGGNVGVGTTVPVWPFHVTNTLGLDGRFLPVRTDTHDFGCNVLRWRNMFISRTIDVNGTTLSNLANGNLSVSSGIDTPRLVMNGVTLTTSTPSPSSVSLTLPNSTVLYPVVMDTSSNTSIQSLRLNTNTVDPLQIFTSNADNIAVLSSRTRANAMVVRGSGYVGVGTGTPLSPLTLDWSNISQADVTMRVTQRGVGGLASFTNTNFPSQGVYITSNAFLGIGTTRIDNALQVSGHGFLDGNFMCMSNVYIGNDLVVAGNTFTRYDQIVDSDKRLKSNLSNIENALDKVCALTGYTYNYMHDTKRSTGLLAQEVKSVLPEAVGSNVQTGMYGVEYGSLMGLIVEAIKDLKKDVDNLYKKLEV